MQRFVQPAPDLHLSHVLGFQPETHFQVETWLHTWDRRGSWAYCHKSLLINTRELVRTQILRNWRSHQVRPTVTLVPIRPQPDHAYDRRPVFLLLPVSIDSWTGFLAVARTPTQHMIGTFLLETHGLPLVSAVFAATMPANQCVWFTNCWAAIGGRAYDFFARLPLFEGAYVKLYEAQPDPSSADTTCTNHSESASSSGGTWPELEDQPGSHRELDPTGRENTATLTQFEGEEPEEAFLMQRNSLAASQPASSPLRAVYIQAYGQPTDPVREAFYANFDQQEEMAISIDTYLHPISWTVIRMSITIKVPAQGHLTDQILQEWQCQTPDLMGFFVYPTPTRGLRRSAIPILLLKSTHDAHLTVVYVALQVMPYTRASLQILDGTTVRELVGLILGRNPDPHEPFVARDMGRPHLTYTLLQQLHVRDGAYLIIYRQRQDGRCRDEIPDRALAEEEVSMMQRYGYHRWEGPYANWHYAAQPLPIWQEIDAILQGLGGRKVSVLTYGVRARHVEARRLDIYRQNSGNTPHLIQCLRTLWSDKLGRQDEIQFYTVMPTIQDARERGEVIIVVDLWPALEGRPMLIQWTNQNTGDRMFFAYRGREQTTFGDVLRHEPQPWDRDDNTHYEFSSRGRRFAVDESFSPYSGQRLNIDYSRPRCKASGRHDLRQVIQNNGPHVKGTTQGDNTATPGEARLGQDDYEQDANTMMQLHLLTPLELEQHRALYEDSVSGIVMINDEIARANDVLRTYVEHVGGPKPGPIWSIYTWFLHSAMTVVALPRVCVMQETRQFTQLTLQTWEDVVTGNSYGVTVSNPLGTALTLRVKPIDLVGIPMQLLRQGHRAFLFDILLGYPRRIAVMVPPVVTLREVVQRIGYTELCAFHECVAVHAAADQVAVWNMDQTINRPHGTLFLLESSKATCKQDQEFHHSDAACDGDSSMLMQTGTLRPKTRPTKLADYCTNYAGVRGPLYIWQHARSEEHRFSTNCRKFRLVRNQETDASLLRDIGLPDVAIDETCIEVVDPPPIFLDAPRLTALVYRCGPHRMPLLLEANRDGAPFLGTVLLDQIGNDVLPKRLFDLSLPLHRCDVDSHNVGPR